VSIEILRQPLPIKSAHPVRNGRLAGVFRRPARPRDSCRRVHHPAAQRPDSPRVGAGWRISLVEAIRTPVTGSGRHCCVWRRREQPDSCWQPTPHNHPFTLQVRLTNVLMLFVKTDHRKRPGGSAEPAASWLETRDVDSEATWRTVRLGRRDCRSPRRGASG